MFLTCIPVKCLKILVSKQIYIRSNCIRVSKFCFTTLADFLLVVNLFILKGKKNSANAVRQIILVFKIQLIALEIKQILSKLFMF